MGRRTTTSPVEKYFEDRSLVAASKSGLVTESSCKCCDAPPFMALTSTRKVAHICGIPGQGILPCSHSVIKLTAEQVGDVASTTKSGREWLERGAGGPSPHLESAPTSNPTGATPSCFFVHVCLHAGSSSRSSISVRQAGLLETFDAGRRLKLDMDLAKGVFYQGNISLGVFEENRHMKRVIAELAIAAGLGGYVPPKRYRLSHELLDAHYDALKLKVDSRMLSASGTEARLWMTGSFDGWDNASKTHLLGQVAMSRRGAIYVNYIDTTGVDLMGKEWTVERITALVELLGGVGKVAAIVLDSPNVNVGALAEYEKANPTVATLLCTCHVISLFLKDAFGKIPLFAESWTKVHQVCKKFRSIKWLKENLQLKMRTPAFQVWVAIQL